MRYDLMIYGDRLSMDVTVRKRWYRIGTVKRVSTVNPSYWYQIVRSILSSITSVLQYDVLPFLRSFSLYNVPRAVKVIRPSDTHCVRIQTHTVSVSCFCAQFFATVYT